MGFAALNPSYAPFVVAMHNVLCYVSRRGQPRIREACMIVIALLAAPGIASRQHARPWGNSPQTT
jgi:hypothetical protein